MLWLSPAGWEKASSSRRRAPVAWGWGEGPRKVCYPALDGSGCCLSGRPHWDWTRTVPRPGKPLRGDPWTQAAEWPEADWGRVQFRDRVCLDKVSFAKRALAGLGRTGGWSPPNRSILQQRIGREGFYSQGYCQGNCDVIKRRPRNPASGCSFAPLLFLPEAPLLIALGFVEVGSPCTWSRLGTNSQPSARATAGLFASTSTPSWKSWGREWRGVLSSRRHLASHSLPPWHILRARFFLFKVV